MSDKKKPSTPREWAAYRAVLSCTIGRRCLAGEEYPPDGINRSDYALYNLLHAIEELAKIHLSKPNQ